MPEIRDPIHGFISLSSDEMSIINTRPFQRLRRIRQLATTYLVYPSAEHTRFPHSIGVMHVSNQMFNKLIEKRSQVLEWSPDEVNRYRQMLRLASLLHDVAHAPFSHAGDNLYDDSVKGHEGMAGKIITETEISPIVQRIGDQHGFGVEEIAAMITGDSYKKEIRMLTNIFASELDSDKMDYLLRDSLYTGVKYGNFDLERIMNVISLFPKEGAWHLGFEYDGVEAVEGLILARYFMFSQVYLHRTRRVYDRILHHLLKDILQSTYGNDRLPVDVEEYLKLDDYSVIEKAKTIKSVWADRFLNRVHLKCVWETEAVGSKESRAQQRKYDSIIKAELEMKYKPEEVIVDQYQKAPVKFEIDEIPTINIISKDSNIITHSFKEKAPIVAKLEDPIYIFRVYTDASIAQQVLGHIQMRYEILKGGK
ncbi:MAG: HD domain-containing protein [Candidatus Cohnella colombiensis]|uniref:HD domain-containing protein n=1 Tax=Candidatus Cohnella colombiensis TaxID=3121368 RepID=A0AA95EXG3_9BACL|nr:MAG: HD domain-containing protein [Cohnella sp.]